MSNDKPGKQKNIDDVLSSIDSLLDTATDASLDDADSSTTKTTSKPKSNQTPNTTVSATNHSNSVAKRPPAPKKRANRPRQPQQKKSDQITPDKTQKADNNQLGNRPSGTVSKPAVVTPKDLSSSDSLYLDNNAGSDIAANDKDKETKVDQAPVKKSPVRNSDSDNHLNFTTVNDDLSQAMRELPVLDDIVSEQDLALIGSGKEPPKKILTEAFKRLSLTDKLIEILENQLSDYDISKLEYKYLHELFDELIEKEKSKPE